MEQPGALPLPTAGQTSTPALDLGEMSHSDTEIHPRYTRLSLVMDARDAPAVSAESRVTTAWEQGLLKEVIACVESIPRYQQLGLNRLQARQQMLRQLVDRLLQMAFALAVQAKVDSVYADITLSPRQCQVLSCLRDGLGTQEIARQWGVTEGTVLAHIRDACSRLDVSGRAMAVQKARLLGLI